MKKITISVFHFREVLGLGLKILFHKNKEIERMLSKKMAFSLMSLITLLALAFVVPSAMAADDFDAEFSVVNKVYNTDIEVTVSFKEEVPLALVQAAKITVHVEDMNGVRTAITVPATDSDNGTAASAESTSEIGAKDTNDVLTGDQVDRKSFVFTIDAASTAEDNGIKKTKVHVFIPAGVARFAPEQLKTSKQATLSFDLMGPIAVNTDRPNVVSIQRLRPGSQTVVSAFEEAKVTGAFDVRIVFTELPHDFKLAHIAVDGGTASGLVVGVPFSRLGAALEITNENPIGTAVQRASTYRPHPLEGMYWHDESGSLVGIPRPMRGTVATTVDTADAAGDLIPLTHGC